MHLPKNAYFDTMHLYQSKRFFVAVIVLSIKKPSDAIKSSEGNIKLNKRQRTNYLQQIVLENSYYSWQLSYLYYMLVNPICQQVFVFSLKIYFLSIFYSCTVDNALVAFEVNAHDQDNML